MRTKKTKTESNHDIINEFYQEHGSRPTSMREIASWGVGTERWQPQRRDLVRLCAEELATAARHEFYTDPQGRRVRKKHAVRGVDEDGNQTYLWADIEAAESEHMRISLSQRRVNILAKCKQVKADLDSYNDNNKHGARLSQLDFNFSSDLDEKARPTEYPDSPPAEG